MSEIISFELKPEEYCELAEAAILKDNAEKAIGYLKKALLKEPRFFKASIMLAKIYMDKYDAVTVANDILYKTIFSGVDEDTLQEIYFLLAMISLKTSDVDVAVYYFHDISEEFDFEFEEFLSERTPDDYRLVYPRGDAFCHDLLSHCYSLVKESKLDEALEELKEIDKNSQYIESANHLKLLIHMLKNDTDGVIDEARNSLYVKDSLSVKCTLATAYMMEDKKKEAYEVMNEITSRDYTDPDEIAVLLPMFVNFESHADVVKYCERLLEKNGRMTNVMIWLSQGLYNIGRKKEAADTMRRVLNVFGDYSPAAFYLEIYESNPEKVPYNLGIPYIEIVTRFKQLHDFLVLNDIELSIAFATDNNFRYLLEWAFSSGYQEKLLPIIERLKKLKNKNVYDFLRAQLVRPDLSYETVSALFVAVLDHASFNKIKSMRFDVVAQERYKFGTMQIPLLFGKLPPTLKKAVEIAICDILFTDEEPEFYIDRLWNVMERIAKTEGDNVVFLKAKPERIRRLRSVKTIVGVLLAKVYEDDEEPVEDAILRYGLNKRTFDKYERIIFSGEDE